jgi:N-acetylglucosamine kinase-like BadF-type ATPase
MVVKNVPSLGYLFGDEGSGAYLGKLFLQDYLKDNIPGSLKKAFINEYNLKLENILDAVYNEPYPSRFLASFAGFIGDHQRSIYLKELLKKSFTDFFREQITHYPKFRDIPLGVVGSIGFHFSEYFKKVAKDFDILSVKFMQSPIDGLVNYHSTEPL